MSYAVGVGFTWLPGQFAILVNIEPYEIMQVLNEPGRRLPRRVIGPHGLSMLGIFGRTASGRKIVVFVRHDDGLDWTIVGGRPMTPREQADFDRWECQ